jgi:hypothetical protein
MANPNIVNVTSIYGKTTGAALGTTLTTSLLANAASSGKVLKVNSIIVSNVDGTNQAGVTIDHYNGTTGFKMANTISVPADASVVILDKSSSIYLEEGQSIRGGASVASDLEIIISYEEIS